MRRFSLLVAALAVALCAGGATASGVASPFVVRSSLDGMSTLPSRIHWVGPPRIPASRIEEVAFLIDGKVRWIERRAPYTYSDDGGYLVTTWLRPGTHRFTVRVRATDGRTATDTVVARVSTAPTIPAAIAGSWRRSVSKQEARSQAPAGVWTLTFERRWVSDKSPGRWDPVKSQKTGNGGVVDSYWVPGPRTFVVAGSVTTRLFDDTDAEGGWWCEPGGPKAIYSWRVTGDTLSLAPVGGHDACADRGSIWTGTWKRA
jgi:hypothetical protein